MIDVELYTLIQESGTHSLADCAVLHDYHRFFTLYLSEKENRFLIVERTKPSMREISFDEFLELSKNHINDTKIQYFIEQYEMIKQKFELENTLNNPSQLNKNQFKI